MPLNVDGLTTFEKILSIIATIITVLGGGSWAIKMMRAYYKTVREKQAQMRENYREDLLTLTYKLEKRVDELETKNEKLNHENTELLLEKQKLQSQVDILIHERRVESRAKNQNT